MNCSKCGATNEAGQRFCYNCGSRIESAVPAATNETVQLPGYQAPPPPAYQPPTTPYQPPQTYQPPAYGQQPLPPAYNQPNYAQPVFTGTAANSQLAVASLVCGIVAWVLFPFIAAIAAIVTGHMARSEIARSGGVMGGKGMALAGLIMGYAQIALTAVAICFFILAIAIAS